MTFEADGFRPERGLDVQFVDGLDQHDDVVTEELQQGLVHLSRPDVPRAAEETWQDRLLRPEAAPKTRALRYDVAFKVMNAADYGAPQKRQRVYVVGFRSDLHGDFKFPEPTHSLDALMRDQWGTGDYWDRHNVRKPKAALAGVRPMAGFALGGGEDAWQTVRDAMADLPEPSADYPA